MIGLLEQYSCDTLEGRLTGRDRLRLFLIEQQDNVKDIETATAVQSAIVGLENLDFGQVDQIFTPTKLGWHGSKPLDLKRYVAHAIGSVIALKRLGYKVSDAEQKVSEAYDVTCEVVHQWRKEYGKTDIPALREIIDLYRVVPSPITGGPKATADHMLTTLKLKGSLYQTAIGGNSVKKAK